MIRKGMVLGVMGALALALSLAGTKPTLAQGEKSCQSVTFDVTGGLVFNPCNGELITLTGSETVTVCTSTDSAGGVHATIRDRQDVSGVGNKGNTYNITSLVTTDANGTAGGTMVLNIVIRLGVVSQGSAPNFHLDETLHITIAPGGTVTVSRDSFSTDCSG